MNSFSLPLNTANSWEVFARSNRAPYRPVLTKATVQGNHLLFSQEPLACAVSMPQQPRCWTLASECVRFQVAPWHRIETHPIRGGPSLAMTTYSHGLSPHLRVTGGGTWGWRGSERRPRNLMMAGVKRRWGLMPTACVLTVGGQLSEGTAKCMAEKSL